MSSQSDPFEGDVAGVATPSQLPDYQDVPPPPEPVDPPPVISPKDPPPPPSPHDVPVPAEPHDPTGRQEKQTRR